MSAPAWDACCVLPLAPQRCPGYPPGVEKDPVIEAYKRDLDRSLLRANLKRTPEERFLQLQELQRFADEALRARKARRK